MPLPVDMSPELLDYLRTLFPAWSDDLIGIYANEWVESGDPQLALARVYTSAEFEAEFPGIKRADGSLRMTEGEYLSYKDAWDATLISVGVNPEYFDETFYDMLTNDVSVREATDRIETAYSQVIAFSPELQAYYAAQAGITDITESAIIASFLDPRVGEEILNKRIGVAQIGASAATRDFTLGLDTLTRLYEVGVTTGQAEEAFGQATELVPILNTLAARHNDPDDDFDINEFVSATLLDDPVERRRMRRLLAQERSTFAGGQTVATDRSGAVVGLADR